MLSLQVDKQGLFDVDKRILFAFLVVFIFLNNYFINELVLTENVYYQTYGEQVAAEHIEGMIEVVSKWQWFGYLLIPLILAIKISFTALCLNIGTIFAGLKSSFAKLFKIAIVAEGIFILARLVKTICFFFLLDVHTIGDVQYFSPLSLINFFDPYALPSWSLYPFTTLNLFEVAYWFLLAMGLHHAYNKKFGEMFHLVMGSYGVGLVVWMVFVVFLSINIS